MAGTKTTAKGGRNSPKPAAAKSRRRFNYPRAGRGPIHRWIPSWRFVLGSFLFLFALGIGTVVTAYVTTKMPDPDEFTTAQSTTIYYSDGETVMGRLAEFNREIIGSDEIPQHMKDAIVAAEDRTFYDNAGVSPTGIMRAVMVNVRGGNRQGGSTITQQYAERYYLGETTDYVGKFKEAILALKLAQDQDKDTILANYLNTIYFGRNAYGIQTAAQAYFEVDAADLTVAQSALIAGIVPAPSAWDPALSPEKAESRWNYVVDGMVATGALTQAERDELTYPETVKIKKSNVLGGPKGYIIDEVKRELVAKSPISEEDLDKRGLKVITTIDHDVQQAAIDAVEQLPEDKPENLQTAVVSIEPGLGAVRAMYAGEDFVTVQRNRATQDIAQAGSTFKPFTLVAALEDGLTLETRLNGNTGRNFEGFESPVRNFAGANYGTVSLLRATQDSVNTAYVDVNLQVTPEATRDVAIRAGIPENTQGLDTFPSNVLGTASVHPIDMAQAYSTFAAEGMRTEPFIVQSVTELDGALVYEGGTAPVREFEPEIMANTTYALTQVVEKGSGKTAREIGRPIAGKTGTSNENKSAWFVGYTPQLATAVALYQMGEDGSPEQITPFGGYSEITGSTVPLDVWTGYMAAALENEPIIDFPARPQVERPAPEPEPTETETEEPTEEPTEEETTPVPDENPRVPTGLTGNSEENAKAALVSAGLDPVVRLEENNAPAGTVIRVEPGEGAQVPNGSSIVLVVSSGPPPPPTEPSPTPPEEGGGDTEDEAQAPANDEDGG